MESMASARTRQIIVIAVHAQKIQNAHLTFFKANDGIAIADKGCSAELSRLKKTVCSLH